MRFSLQINILVGDVNYNEKFKPFSKMVVPYANILVEHEMADDMKEQFRLIHNIVPIVWRCMEVVLFLTGAGILVFLFHAKFNEILFPRSTTGYHIPESIILERSNSIYLRTDKKL